MKFDKMSSLSWSVFVAVLLFSLGAASNDMVSAAPAPVSANDQPSIRVKGQYPTGFPKGQPTRGFPKGQPPAQGFPKGQFPTGFPKRAVPTDIPKDHHPTQSFPKGHYHTGSPKKAAPIGHSKKVVPTSTETVYIAVPTTGPFRFRPSMISLPVEPPVNEKRQDGEIETAPESYAIDLVEEDDERDKEVSLSKRRMQVYGAIRYVNPADIRKRDHLSSASAFATDITPEEEFESESESEPDKAVELSKRRAMVYGRVEYVGHPKYYQPDLPEQLHPTTTVAITDTIAALEEQKE
ncbi:MAG: hypothetical protein JOS17DRAFT_829885 [Linnemannia elongata]|nr:MAG: hypothetical protein JOS17DRAFT_829885 [Linnemannia elongata]